MLLFSSDGFFQELKKDIPIYPSFSTYFHRYRAISSSRGGSADGERGGELKPGTLSMEQSSEIERVGDNKRERDGMVLTLLERRSLGSRSSGK